MERHANGRFRPDASEIASARRFVRSSLLSWGLCEEVPSLELAVSELVTNAMVHGEGEVEVQLTARGSHMRLEVLDQGRDAATPAQREIGPGERGRLGPAPGGGAVRFVGGRDRSHRDTGVDGAGRRGTGGDLDDRR